MDLTNINKDRKLRRKTSPLDLGTMMYGKIPPQAKDMEEAVLGAIMNEKGAFDIISDILNPSCFYVEANQRIYHAMQGLQQKNSPIDLLTVVEELRFREEIDLVGGPYYVMKLTNNVVSSANIEAHSRIILQKFMQREVIRISSELLGEAYEDSTDVFDLLDMAQNSVFNLTTNYVKKDYSHISSGLVKVMDRIEDLRKQDSSITGVYSGFQSLDSITHGWQPSDFIVLAARPSVGKTAFALNLARNASMHPEKPVAVGFFSLEMSERQIISRALSSQSRILLKKISTGRLGEDEMKTIYSKGVQPLSQAPIYFDYTAGLSVFELKSKVRRMVSKHKVGLIIIDYLQLMVGNSENRNTNREQEISRISREIKGTAKELDIPIIALSQLSREVEKRAKGQKEPQLSDLRESGAIEQDSDLVMFLYRPPEDEVKDDPELKNKGTLKISKHRNGELAELYFQVSNNIQVWEEKINIPSGYKPVAVANAEQAAIFNNGEDPEDLPF